MGLILNNCCCCYDLKSGTLVVGIIILIIDIFTIIYTAIFYCIDKGILETYYPIEKRNISDLKLILIILIGTFGFFITTLMIWGSCKYKYKLMLPYLIIIMISLMIGFILSWYFIIKNFITSVIYGCMYLIFLNSTTAIVIYSWLVVYSRSEEIMIINKNRRKRVLFSRKILMKPL